MESVSALAVVMMTPAIVLSCCWLGSSVMNLDEALAPEVVTPICERDCWRGEKTRPLGLEAMPPRRDEMAAEAMMAPFLAATFSSSLDGLVEFALVERFDGA